MPLYFLQCIFFKQEDLLDTALLSASLGWKVAFTICSIKERVCHMAHSSPLSAPWEGDLVILVLSLRSFLNNRLTKVLERCRLVLPSAALFSFCCLLFLFLSSVKENRSLYYALQDVVTGPLCSSQRRPNPGCSLGWVQILLSVIWTGPVLSPGSVG